MRKRVVNNLSLILAIGALAIAMFALWTVSNNQDQPSYQFLTPSGDVTDVAEGEMVMIPAEMAEQIANDLNKIDEIETQASSAADSADTILSFIEGGSILIGALLAIAFFAFGASIQDVRSQLDESVTEAERRLQDSEDRMEALLRRSQKQVQDAISAGQVRLEEREERMQTLTNRVEDSIRDTENMMTELQGRFNDTVSSLHQAVTDAVEGAKKEAENSFQVLSLLLLAEQQVRARNRQTAIATLQEAHKIDPKDQTTNYLLGYLHVGRKEFDVAIQHLQQALAHDPNFAPALAAMGLAQRRMGDAAEDDMNRRELWANAEANLIKALKSDPGLIDADDESYYGTLGGLYRRQGRNQDALSAYEQAVNVTPNRSYPVGNLAMLYKKLGHEEKAKVMYDRAIEISEAILDDHPGDTWARLDLAQAFLVSGQKRKALEEYHNVIGRLQEPSPLETALSGLRFLEETPQPIDGISQVLNLLQDGIQNLQIES